jgi:hypothetical protein
MHSTPRGDVTAEDFWTAKAAELEEQVVAARRCALARGHASSWFVFFRTQAAAAAAASMPLHARDNFQFNVRRLSLSRSLETSLSCHVRAGRWQHPGSPVLYVYLEASTWRIRRCCITLPCAA